MTKDELIEKVAGLEARNVQLLSDLRRERERVQRLRGDMQKEKARKPAVQPANTVVREVPTPDPAAHQEIARLRAEVKILKRRAGVL